MPYRKVLNFKRVGNLISLYTSFWLSRLFKKPIVFGAPFSMSFEPTTACNLGCPECPSGLKQFTRPTGKLEMEKHKAWLAQVSSTVFYINYYFQGEPFIHPQFLELIKEAKRHRIFTATSTNAHFIDGAMADQIVASGLDQLIISVDGFSQSVYESYRIHGHIEKVWSATAHLVHAKKMANSRTPKLIFQCLAVKPNEHEMGLIQDKATELGVDELRVKSAQFYDYEHGNPLMPENEKYSRYVKKSNGTYALKNPGGNHCWRMWSGSVVTWDGKVVPCCFDKDAKHVIGNLNQESFKTIWKSKAYQTFRYGVLNARHAVDICKNCSEGSKVWL